jgi:YbbR domain-containing protein
MPSRSEQFFESQQLKLYFKNILRKVFLEDWAMKLAALLITFALWIGVTGLSQPAVQRMNGIPLFIRYSENVDVTSTVEELNIVVSGDKRKIELIRKEDLIVSLDLTGVEPGDRVVQLMPDTISLPLPSGIKIDEITPRQITVKIEPLEIKEVSVSPVTSGQVPEGFEVYGQTVSPPRIHVRGPANLVRSLAMVTTDKIDLTDKNADFTARQVPVNISNATKITPLDSLVDVSFRIGEKRIEKTFIVPVKEDPKRKVNVVLYGGKSLFDDLKSEDLSVEIVKDGSGAERPTVILPSRLVDKVEIRKPKAER